MVERTRPTSAGCRCARSTRSRWRSSTARRRSRRSRSRGARSTNPRCAASSVAWSSSLGAATRPDRPLDRSAVVIRLGPRRSRRSREAATTATSTGSPTCSPGTARCSNGERAVDFDDQIYRALLEILLRDPTARRTAQRACRSMLVDEFQDLTPAHLLLMRLLAAPGGAVFGVGDDDQTIYGYNGADPAWLIDFAELFPGAGEHPLEVNYRCPAGVVDVVDTAAAAQPASSRQDASGPHRPTSDGFMVGRHQRRRGRRLAPCGRGPPLRPVLRRPTSPCSPGSTRCSHQCRWHWWSRVCPIAGGVGLEFADRTAVRTVARLVAARHGATGGVFAPDDIGEALRRPSRSLHPRIADWVSEQSSVVELRRARRAPHQRA